MAGLLGFFDYNKPGKGLRKEDVQKEGLPLYFDILWRRIGKLLLLNLIYLLFSIPAIAALWFVSIYGIAWLASVVDIDIAKISVEWFELGMISTAALVFVFGTGAPSAGMAYVIREFVRDTHSWVWSDFKDNFKSNFLQATAVFLLDMLIIAACFVGFIFYRYEVTGSVSTVLCVVTVVAFAIFTMMHLYIYPIMVTFKLKIRDIYRNSFLIVLARLPWNVLVALVSAILVYVIIYLAINSFIGVIALLFAFIPILVFTQMFMTNSVIEELLLKPALKDNGEKEAEEPDFDDELHEEEQE